MATPANRKKPWDRTPKIIERIAKVRKMHLDDMSDMEIAHELGVHQSTVWHDRQRAIELLKRGAVADMEGARQEAIDKHRHRERQIMKAEGEADSEDASGRAKLFRAANDHQVHGEELKGIRPMKGQDAPSATAQVLVIQVGDAEPKQIEEMSTEELAEVKEVLRERLSENGQQQIEGTAEEVED